VAFKNHNLNISCDIYALHLKDKIVGGNVQIIYA
jgi:hypothetical protein